MITVETEQHTQSQFKVYDLNKRQLAQVQSFDPILGEGIIYWPINSIIPIQEVLSSYIGIKIKEIFPKDSKTYFVSFQLEQYILEKVKK